MEQQIDIDLAVRFDGCRAVGAHGTFLGRMSRMEQVDTRVAYQNPGLRVREDTVRRPDG